MYVYVYIHIQNLLYVFMHIHILTYTYIYIDICICLHILEVLWTLPASKSPKPKEHSRKRRLRGSHGQELERQWHPRSLGGSKKYIFPFRIQILLWRRLQNLRWIYFLDPPRGLSKKIKRDLLQMEAEMNRHNDRYQYENTYECTCEKPM